MWRDIEQRIRYSKGKYTYIITYSIYLKWGYSNIKYFDVNDSKINILFPHYIIKYVYML